MQENYRLWKHHLVGLAAKGSQLLMPLPPTTGYKFVAIQVTEDAIFNALVGNMVNPTGLSLGAGTIIYGLFTSITLTSGKVIAYMGV